jgi:hypothetical protein
MVSFLSMIFSRHRSRSDRGDDATDPNSRNARGAYHVIPFQWSLHSTMGGALCHRGVTTAGCEQSLDARWRVSAPAVPATRNTSPAVLWRGTSHYDRPAINYGAEARSSNASPIARCQLCTRLARSGRETLTRIGGRTCSWATCFTTRTTRTCDDRRRLNEAWRPGLWLLSWAATAHDRAQRFRRNGPAAKSHGNVARAVYARKDF